MQDYQPTLEDRINDRERVKVDLSRTSQLSILFAVEGVIKELVGTLVVQDNYQEAGKVLESIADLTASLTDFAIHSKEYDTQTVHKGKSKPSSLGGRVR